MFTIFFLISGSAHAACNCQTVEEVMTLTLESMNANSSDAIEAFMTPPDTTSVTSCLSAVRAGLEGYFTLSLPSIADLLSGACNMIVDAVYSSAFAHIDTLLDSVSSLNSSYFSIQWGDKFGQGNDNNGNAMWTIDGDIVNFAVVDHDVDLTGNIRDLFN